MSNGSEVGSEDFDTSNSDADLSLSDYDEEDVEPRTIQTVQTEEHAATLQVSQLQTGSCLVWNGSAVTKYYQNTALGTRQ